jgi:hypothetical protein
MISDRTAVQTLGRTAIPRTWHTPFGRDWVATIAATTRRVARAVRSFAKVPPLPYAALWEASVLVSLVKAADRDKPDSFPTQTVFPTDDGFWNRF